MNLYSNNHITYDKTNDCHSFIQESLIQKIAFEVCTEQDLMIEIIELWNRGQSS